MKRALTALTVLSLMLALGARAEAQNYADDPCPDGGFIVDTPDKAATVANGYVRDDCGLIIKTTIKPLVGPVTLSHLIIRAKSITIDGPDVLNPGNPVEIINPIAGGEIDLISEKGGNITIDNAQIWARGVIKVVCSGGLCKIKVEASSIIAANPLGDTTSLQGDVFFSAVSDIDIKTSTVYGGAGIHMGSDKGHIVWICTGGGSGDCKDPNQAPIPPIILSQCLAPPPAPPNTIQFPCTATFADSTELRSVCFPGTPGVVCGGGSNEIRITAFTFVDITGSTIIALDHITIESKTAEVRAANSVITAKDAINVSAFTFIDLQGADWEAKRITAITGGGCSGATICINMNGPTTSMVATDQIGMSANNNTGVITLCNGATVTAPQVVLNGKLCTSDPSPPFVKANPATCVPPFGTTPCAKCG